MPRTMHPDLTEALDRANPYVDTLLRVTAPDVSSVYRRSDQFIDDPAKLVSETPAASGAVNAAGSLVLASSNAQVFAATTVSSFRSLNSDPIGTRLKATGWKVDPAFKGGTLRTFSAYVQRNLFGGSFYLPLDFTLQIFRATGVHEQSRNLATGGLTPFTTWTFTPLLDTPAPKPYESITWSSDRAWVDFDLTGYGIEVVPSTGRPFGASADGELEVYYFRVDVVDAPITDLFRWLTDSVTARTVAGVGTFQRREWARDSADGDALRDPWVETLSADVHCCKVALEGYVASSTRVYAHDLGRAPTAGGTGRVIFEHATPTGTGATIEVSTAGSGGPWTAYNHGDPITTAQQTYHSRLTLTSDADGRRTPAVHAFGIEWRGGDDLAVEGSLDWPTHAVNVPYLEASIADGGVTLVRTGVRDYEDAATVLASTKPTPQLEAEVYLGTRHEAIGEDAWLLMERMPVSQRSPSEVEEHLTLLSYANRLKRKIPARTESVNLTCTVVSALANGTSVTVDPAVPGAGSGHELLNKGYYLRVRKSSALPVGYVHTIEDNSASNALTFTAVPLPAQLAAGDVVEVHSGQFGQPVLQWIDADPADIWLEIITTHCQVPDARVGLGGVGRAGRSGLPPRVTDISSDPATQAALKVTFRSTEAEKADELIDQLSFIMGGVTTEIAGQIVFRQIYPLVDATGNVTVPAAPVSAVWDNRDYYGLSTPTGSEDRLSALACDYGKNLAAADPDSTPSKTVVFADTDAVAWLSDQDAETDAGIDAVPDKIARWLYNSADEGLLLATLLSQRVVGACSTGKRVWSWSTRDAHPEMVVGDRVTLLTDRYTDYDPGSATPIAGWWAYTLVLVSVGEGGRKFSGYMLGLQSARKLRGGPGTLQGASAPIDCPAIMLAPVTAMQLGVGNAKIRISFTAPADPFFREMRYSVRFKEPNGSYGASVVVRGSRSGPDVIDAQYGLVYEVTPSTVSSGGTVTAGTAQVITMPGVGATPTVVATDGTDAVNYAITYDALTTTIEVWTAEQATDPGTASQENAAGAMLFTTLRRGDGRSALSIPTTDAYRGTTFIPYAGVFRGEPIPLSTQHTGTATAPTDLGTVTNSSKTATTVTNRVNLAASHVAGDQIETYRNGATYGSLYLITSTDVTNGFALVTSTGLTASTPYSWKYKAVRSGVRSANYTAAINVTTNAAVLDAPGIVAERDGSDPCASAIITISAGFNNPPGQLFQIESSATGVGGWVVATNTATEGGNAVSATQDETFYRAIALANSSGTQSSPSNTDSIPDHIGPC